MKQLFVLIFSVFGFYGFAQVNLSLVYNWNDSTIIGSAFFDNAYNEVWGYTQNGREYAIIGSTEGTHTFDVTNTQDIKQVDFQKGKFTGQYVIHRDYHDYKGYLYAVCDEGQSSLQIFDLSGLPDSTHKVYDEDSLFRRSHNIFIDTAAGIMYSCGGDDQFTVFSLANPTAPKLLLDCGKDVSFWGPIGYIHDVYVENGIAYLSAGNNGFFIVDFKDPQNPLLLGSLTQYPDQGYNHSGWLHQNGKIYAMADETWGMDIKILDVEDPTDIKVVSQINSNVNTNSIVHNLIFQGDYLFISYYYDGVYVYDLKDPANPQLAATYDTSPLPHKKSYEGCWGVYPFLPSGLLVASDMQEGLFVFDTKSLPLSSLEAMPTNFDVFPNPFNNHLKITGIVEDVEVLLTDISGRIVFQQQLPAFENTIIFNKEIPEGIYFLKIQGDTFAASKKLIKH